ncbi:hypothetical protein SAMN05660485_00299 [Blastococcus fimeti]|nr:hypothetical protein SAMN05660485_00299 [Blastococcus fimeti]
MRVPGDSHESLRTVGRIDWSSLGADPAGDLSLFAGCEDVAQLSEALRQQVEAELGRIRDLVGEADAFDVIELMRMREIPPVPDLTFSIGHEGSAAVVELVALQLLARESRKPDPIPREETQPHEAVDELHARASRLLRLATFKMQIEGRLQSDEPLARLASEYQSSLVSIRAMQYAVIQDRINDELFDNPTLDSILRETLGFTYKDLVRVRDGIQSVYSEKLIRVRDILGAVAVESRGGRVAQSDDRINEGRQAFIDFLFLPGVRASFRIEDITEATGIARSTVRSVLDKFSTSFGMRRDSTDVTLDFLRGRNPLATTTLVVDAAGNYLLVSLTIGTDSLRRLVEAELKETAHWKRYERVRTMTSERLAKDSIAAALRPTFKRANVKYFSPRDGISPTELGRDCADLTGLGQQTEADGLFINGDVAICLEVKARSIADQARSGDLLRLIRDLRATIGSAAQQARRLELLIESNGGLWLEDRTWLDLSNVQEVRSIVVGLDDYGPAGIVLDELRRGGIIADSKLPWVASLHDLMTISLTLDRPAEFLLYVQRRSASGVARHYRAVDELDLFMLFLQGGLFVEPDPDEVYQRYPSSQPPTKADYRRFNQDNQTTRVGTFTDPLDAWVYSMDGDEGRRVSKPTFRASPWVLRLVDHLADRQSPGWLRFGADLLALSGRAQSELASATKKLIKQTRIDGKPHRLAQGFAGDDGYVLVVAQTRPGTAEIVHSTASLETYLRAKKHHIRADRALGILVEKDSSISHVFYEDKDSAGDPDMDALVTAMQLGSVPPTGRPIPPLAKRYAAAKRKRKGLKR